jgi:hypothetical protein
MAAFRHIHGVDHDRRLQPDSLPAAVVADARQGHCLIASSADLTEPPLLHA